jgi:hypothetical protein
LKDCFVAYHQGLLGVDRFTSVLQDNGHNLFNSTGNGSGGGNGNGGSGNGSVGVNVKAPTAGAGAVASTTAPTPTLPAPTSTAPPSVRIPFRAHLLTKVLKQCFSPHTRTTLMTTLSPTPVDLQHSLNSLAHVVSILCICIYPWGLGS